MNFKDFAELRQFVRRYNSISILEVGAQKCWQHWETNYSNSNYTDWLLSNIRRNYAIRLMLLASASNPYRNRISIEEFDNAIQGYYAWDNHTISDEKILNEEAKVLLESIQRWEINNESSVRNWSFKLSNLLSLELIRKHIAGLFAQRTVAFQNAGFGFPSARVTRTIKFIELLDKCRFPNDYLKKDFSQDFLSSTKLYPEQYFKQFLGCLALFGFSPRKGFFDLSHLHNIPKQFQEFDITPESLEIFIRQNSAPFSAQVDTSFRSRINQALNGIPEFYQLFFYNQFLETPFVDLGNNKFCLPDPSSFIESSWNQVRSHVFEKGNNRKLNGLLSNSFEFYLKDILLPCISPESFKKIPETTDKRADFLIEAQNSYIVLECKNSLMHYNTSAYFPPDKVADLWCRTHSACEQISATIKAFNLRTKPVIPLVMTFYDAIAASAVFEEMLKETSYCSRLGLTMPPIVHSLHEFEHLISDRSLNNWVELSLSKQNQSLRSVKPDNKGHNYKHLNSTSIIQITSE